VALSFGWRLSVGFISWIVLPLILSRQAGLKGARFSRYPGETGLFSFQDSAVVSIDSRHE
jgi:hypothetical protein